MQQVCAVVQHLTAHNKAAWRVYYVVNLLVVGAVVYSLLSVMLGTGESWKEFHNSYCLPSNNTSNSNCVNQYNFKKVVFFWCDGVSWDTATPLFDVFPTNQNVFKVRHRDNPWSAWIFNTLMSGKANRNMGKLNNDNLMYQFFQAGMKVMLGVSPSPVYVINQVDYSYKKETDMVTYYPKFTDDNTRMFESLFSCGKSTSTYGCVESALGLAKADDRSVFLESWVLDHQAHGEKSRFGAKTLEFRDKLAADIVSVKQWIDANPEYLLVMVSDHGQMLTSSDLDIHGDWLQLGNEGWMLVYNPSINLTISYPSNPVVLNTVDIAPTFVQFFSANGVSIPAESAGKVFPVTTSAEIRFNALKTNAVQIRALLKKEKPFKYSHERWNKALKLADEGNYEQGVVEMERYISGFTDEMYKNVGSISIWSLFVGLISFALSLAIQFRTYRNFRASVSMLGFGIVASPYVAWIIYALFYTQPSDNVIRYQAYIYAIPLCCMLASYTAKLLRAEVSDETQPLSTGSTTGGSNEYELLQKGEESADIGDSGEMLIRDSLNVKRGIRDYFTKNALKELFNYIIGNQKSKYRTIDFRLLTFVGIFACFACIQNAFGTRNLGIDNVGDYWKYKWFWVPFAFFTLWLEFRQQRILLTTYIGEIYSTHNSVVKQLFHSAFLPLNLKMFLYFILLILSIHPGHSAALFVYTVTFLHIGILIFCPPYIQRDLVLPVFILTFMLNTPKEKEMLCMLVIILHFLSSVFESLSPLRSASAVARSHLTPLLIVLLVSLSHFFFSMMDNLQYKLDQLNLNVAGIYDITKYPIFSVVMMGAHYAGIFLITIPFLIRTLNPTPPPLVPLKIGRFSFGHQPAKSLPSAESDSESSRYSPEPFTVTFLTMGCSLSLFVYKMNLIGTVSDVPLVWCFFLCVITIGYGVCVLCSEAVSGTFSLTKTKCNNNTVL